MTAQHSIERRAVVVHGREITYLQRGDVQSGNAVLVLLHGIASSSSSWEALLGSLPTDVVSIAPDLPGHGRSDGGNRDYTLAGHANTIRDLLASIGVASATLVGHSYGGGVAMQIAYQHPDLCERLVLVSSGGLGPDVTWLLRLLSLPGTEFVLPFLAPSFVREAGNSLWATARKLGLRAPKLEQSWRAFTAISDPENRVALFRTLRGVIGPSGQVLSAQDRLYLAAEIPTLIVWGEQDHTIPVIHAYAAHESLPCSDLIVLERCSHFPHHEQPEAFVEALTAFLDRTTATTLHHEGVAVAVT